MNNRFIKMGCIDIKNDLWANIACKLLIHPNTCGREKKCDKCSNFNNDILLDQKIMKIYKIQFDCSEITLLAEDDDEMIKILMEVKGSQFNVIDGKLFYLWSKNNNEECDITLIPMKSGIIHNEFH